MAWSKIPLSLVNQIRWGLHYTKKIDFKGVFLLLLYLFASSPFNLLHHHQYNIPNFKTADLCELATYYGDNRDELVTGHKNHISKTPIDCFLCDHHISVDCQPPSLTYTIGVDFPIFITPPVYHNSFHSLYRSPSANKDPPIV